MSSAGRRPARSTPRRYFRGFLARGDEVRAILRMRPDHIAQLSRIVRRRGFIWAHDRLSDHKVRLYVRSNVDLLSFAQSLPYRLTALDRMDIRVRDELVRDFATFDPFGLEESHARDMIEREEIEAAHLLEIGIANLRRRHDGLVPLRRRRLRLDLDI